jgi:hypothetical protein
MSQPLRKRSPQAPSISLEDALNKALKVYDKERRHEVPVDVVAVDMGYKSSNSGTALQALASIRYFGLMHRTKVGLLSVSIDVEKYKFSPEPELKQRLLTSWLRTPQIFAELLDKFSESLPSDATIKYELIQMGFNPSGADDFIAIFKKSVEFVRYYEQISASNISEEDTTLMNEELVEETTKPIESPTFQAAFKTTTVNQDQGTDRVPIRLAGSRKAFLEIPTPFYETDKERIINQINLILTDKEDANDIK